MKKEFKTAEQELLHKIKQETNIDTQIWAARSVANVFDMLKIEYPRTDKTQMHLVLLKIFYKNIHILLLI